MDGVASLEMRVSSGTYVRSIADALGGHCRTLRRLEVGPFSVDDADDTVVRPAAADWDEREETPWPILQQAAKIGLYSFEFLHTSFGDETGLTMPLVNEELFWGDAGIGLSVFGTHLASAAIFASEVSGRGHSSAASSP